MKEKFKKVIDVLKLIFGYGIMITLFVGGLTFFGYVFALIVGGNLAVTICAFIYKTIVPIIIYASTSLVLFGIVIMYLSGETALTSGKKKISKSEGER